MTVNSSKVSARLRKRLRGFPRARAGIAWAVVAALAVGFPTTSAGSDEPKLYSWTDDEGVIRYTPHRDRVPSSRRSTVQVVQHEPELPDVASEPPQLISQTPVRVRAPDPEPVAPATVVEPEVVAQATIPVPESLVPVAPEPLAPAWVVQLSASPVGASPDPVPAVVLPEGTALYRVPAQVGGADWQRLRLGFFDSSSAAQAAARQLEASFPGAWVARVGPAERTSMAAIARLPDVAAAPPSLTPPAQVASAPAQVASAPAPSLAVVAAATPATPSPRPLVVLPDVGATGERRFAIQLRSVPLAAGPTPLPLLAASEFRLYRTTVEVDGQVWERLRLGFFDDEKAARHELSQLGRSFSGAWIVSVSPSERMLASRTTTGPSDSELPPS